jgi:hypothetical protein
LTAVGVGVGSYYGIKALSAKSDYDDTPTNELADDVEKHQLISDLGFGAALTFGITALVYMTQDPKPAAQGDSARARTPRIALSPFASPQTAGASARFRF